jgi:hypothetical protein
MINFVDVPKSRKTVLVLPHTNMHSAQLLRTLKLSTEYPHFRHRRPACQQLKPLINANGAAKIRFDGLPAPLDVQVADVPAKLVEVMMVHPVEVSWKN